MGNHDKVRSLYFYKDYFEIFFVKQNQKVKDKIIWTFELLQTQVRLSENYFKLLEPTEGIYEIRVQLGSNNIRILCFFDRGKLIVVANAFYKKTQKTPKQEIIKAITIKKEYESEKE